jgi:hypothetical protein
MSISDDLRQSVRTRANFACEYCTVSETDTGGELTIDHFQPKAKGGSDEAENLLYCCVRCNLYKADYWPTHANQPHLWNPRLEPIASHLLILTDGTLYSTTPVGEFTVTRLRLNRPPLVAYRLGKAKRQETELLLQRYREVIRTLEQLSTQQALLLEENRILLEEQRRILQMLLNE